MTQAILVSRAARSLAYGALAVVLAEALAARGFTPVGIGAAITVALLAGAVTSAFTGRLVRAMGSRTTFAAGGIAMIVAAALMALLVPPFDRARAAGVTAAVRPAAASVAPVLTGIAFQFAAAGLPFVLVGAIKIAYDLSLLATFRGVPLGDLQAERRSTDVVS